MAPDESELQSLFCLCECRSTDAWGNTGITPSSLCPVPALDSTSCKNPVADASRCPWADLLIILDNANVMKNINCIPNEQIVIFYNDSILARCFSDAFDCGDSWPVWITGRCVNNNIEDVFKAVDPDRSNLSTSKDHQDHSQTYVIHKEQTDSYIKEDGLTTEERSGGVRRKSVSFADDVIVYLFDKDSPTEVPRLMSSSSVCSDNLFDDNGLEWEDDFLALEMNRQTLGRPKHWRRPTSPLPTQNWTLNMPKSFVLSPSCLFLTHVSESDLEL